MWDGGLVCGNHPEYAGRALQGIYETPSTTVSTHATHVAGTMIATGIDGNSIGMAPSANLNYYTMQGYAGELSLEAADGLLLSNHSWNNIYQPWIDFGGGSFGWNLWVNYAENPYYGLYTIYSKNEDLIANNAPYHLIVRSAGNERGYGPTIGATHSHLVSGIWTPGF